MALDPRRRQKQLARKAAKRKKQVAAKRREHGSITALLEHQVASAPIHECLVPENLFDLGLGNLIVSRSLGPDLAAGVFLVDVFCLGIKNAFFTIVNGERYRELVAGCQEQARLVPIDPACALKLVEQVIAYARDLGFAPHKDYHRARVVLGGIDAEACAKSFQFGKDNKPLFVAGPNDSPARCQQIMQTLARRCGPDGFHYLVGMPIDGIDE